MSVHTSPPQQLAGEGQQTSPSISTKPFEIDAITDHMAPYLPPHQAALASLSLSASLLHSPSPAHLLASSYLLQRKRHYTTSAFAQLLTSLAHSSTLYIGNLSFTTREEQLLSTFHLPTLAFPTSLHMGLNSLTKQPCGFAFVAFATAQQAQTTRAVLHTLAVDERTVGIDMDQRFKPGREWGRGKSGGQIRDEVRQGWDKGRGGWGARERRQQQMREMKEQQKSTFKRMGEGEEQQEQREEEDASAQQQQRAKREHGSYAHAQAMRRAGAQQTKAVEADTEEEEDRSNKRQKVHDVDVKQPYDNHQQQPATTDDDGYDGSSQHVDEGDGGGTYYGEGEEEEGMDEQKTSEGAEWTDERREEQEQQVEEEEAEHGFATAGDEENDEPQWT